MVSPSPLPAAVLAELLRVDAARPRITCYDDTPGPTAGERIELSARVLGNWVNKAANALLEEYDVQGGQVVRLDLPPHWRTAYWALAVWQCGGCVALDDGAADVLVTTDAVAASAFNGEAVLVSLPALSRSAADCPDGVMDEARELSTYGDAFLAVADPVAGDPGLRATGVSCTLDAVVPVAAYEPGSRVHLRTPRTSSGTAAFLDAALGAWAVDGSLVLSLGEPGADLTSRAASEGVTTSA